MGRPTVPATSPRPAGGGRRSRCGRRGSPLLGAGHQRRPPRLLLVQPDRPAGRRPRVAGADARGVRQGRQVPVEEGLQPDRSGSKASPGRQVRLAPPADRAVHFWPLSTARLVGLSAVAVVLVVSAPGMSRPSSAQAPPAPRVAQTGSDFNGDGFDDLPVAAPEEDVEPLIDSGAVHVLYGTAEGLSGGSGQFLTQDSPGVPGVAESNEEFGRALASGDFDGDGFSDLAVGTPGEDDEGLGTTDSGAVNVLYGSAEGVTAAGAQYFTQDTPGVRDRVESFDQFGEGLGAADFNGDGFADLAVGAWGEGVGTVSSAGAVE